LRSSLPLFFFLLFFLSPGGGAVEKPLQPDRLFFSFSPLLLCFSLPFLDAGPAGDALFFFFSFQVRWLASRCGAEGTRDAFFFPSPTLPFFPQPLLRRWSEWNSVFETTPFPPSFFSSLTISPLTSFSSVSEARGDRRAAGLSLLLLFPFSMRRE